jgi:hypothetical protein
MSFWKVTFASAPEMIRFARNSVPSFSATPNRDAILHKDLADIGVGANLGPAALRGGGDALEIIPIPPRT